MSRSIRKTSYIGNTNSSDKKDKRIASRRFRRREKQAIYHECEPPIDPKEVSDEYNFNKDGKHYFDSDEYSDLMRK